MQLALFIWSNCQDILNMCEIWVMNLRGSRCSFYCDFCGAVICCDNIYFVFTFLYCIINFFFLLNFIAYFFYKNLKIYIFFALLFKIQYFRKKYWLIHYVIHLWFSPAHNELNAFSLDNRKYFSPFFFNRNLILQKTKMG